MIESKIVRALGELAATPGVAIMSEPIAGPDVILNTFCGGRSFYPDELASLLAELRQTQADW